MLGFELESAKFGNMIFFANTLFVLSVLLLTLMSVVLFRQRRLSTVVFFANAGYAVIAIANAIDLIKEFGDEIYLEASLIYVIGSIILSISVQFFSRLTARRMLSLPVWSQADFYWHVSFAIKLVLTSFVLMTLARGDNIFLDWSEARESNGFLVALATFLFMLSSPGIISSVFAKRFALGFTLLVLCLGLLIVIGSRAAFLGFLFLGAWVMLTRARNLTSRFKICAVALIAILLVHTFLRTLRSFGISGLLQAFNEGYLLTTLFAFALEGDANVTGGESDIAKTLLFAITQSSISDFGFATSIQRLLLLPIPNIQGWINKPVDVTNQLWKSAFEQGLLAGDQGQAVLLESYKAGALGSWHPTIFGEYFLAGGWVALVLSVVVLGAVLVMVDIFMHRTDRLISLALCGPVMAGYLFVARGNSVVGLGFFVYLSVLVGVSNYLVIKFKKFRAPLSIRNSDTLKLPNIRQ